MRNAIMRIAAGILVIAVTLSGIGVAVAQEGVVEDESEVPVLAVEAPQNVEVSTSTTIKVTDRENGTPVPAASVYALTWPNHNVTDFAGIILSTAYNCEFLGKTTNDGSVDHTFDRVGRVLIVATKEQWGPGLARLTVKPHLIDRLAINAPVRAAKDGSVTIGVVERDSKEQVDRADVWAITGPIRFLYWETNRYLGEMKGLIKDVSEIDVNNGGNDTEWLERIGVHLGQTDSQGELECVFDEVGTYMLWATKNEYLPGSKVIVIVEDKTLVIRADSRIADIGEDVIFTAKTGGTSTPVGGVDLYIMKPGWFSSGTINLKEIGTAGEALGKMAIDHGEYIGTTDEDGQFIYQFQEKGVYLIVGTEDGYLSGSTTVFIGQFGGIRQLLPMPQIQRFKERLEPKWDWPDSQGIEEHKDYQDKFPQLRRFRR